jgi:hypothetical protein
MRKRELAEVRPWEILDCRPFFRGQVDDFITRDTRVRLFIHEAY